MPYTFKKHGQFVVTVRATNSAGHFDASTEVTVLGRLLSPGGVRFSKPPKYSGPEKLIYVKQVQKCDFE